jgi:hypothetical protein
LSYSGTFEGGGPYRLSFRPVNELL